MTKVKQYKMDGKLTCGSNVGIKLKLLSDTVECRRVETTSDRWSRTFTLTTHFAMQFYHDGLAGQSIV